MIALFFTYIISYHIICASETYLTLVNNKDGLFDNDTLSGIR